MPVEIIDCEQNTPEWFEARRGLVTASMFKTVMAKGEGKTRSEYMRKLAGEIISGQPMENFTNKHMQHGHQVEAEAIAAYEFLNDVTVERVGFIKNGRKGASPDGLVEDRGTVEIKRKAPHLLIEIILANRIPPAHAAQIQGQLWVSERDWCDFTAYYPDMPPFTKRMERDEAYIADLAIEVAKFQRELDALVEKIRAYGGGA